MADSCILLVEDSPSDEVFTLRALKKANILNRVIVVRDGASALDFLFSRGAYTDRDPGDAPEIILLDLNLPKLGGLDVLRAVRADERTKLLPVIILTSSGEERDLVASYGLGANSYVVKPIDFTRFSEAVNHLGLYWLVVNRAAPVPTDAC